ncbi:MAG: hypothetical protein GX443_19165 [Deltaproteobacteria bacterium]|nr:hypothetical protein [Deltaproteobacteria bacterium]
MNMLFKTHVPHIMADHAVGQAHGPVAGRREQNPFLAYCATKMTVASACIAPEPVRTHESEQDLKSLQAWFSSAQEKLVHCVRMGDGDLFKEEPSSLRRCSRETVNGVVSPDAFISQTVCLSRLDHFFLQCAVEFCIAHGVTQTKKKRLADEPPFPQGLIQTHFVQ